MVINVFIKRCFCGEFAAAEWRERCSVCKKRTKSQTNLENEQLPDYPMTLDLNLNLELL